MNYQIWGSNLPAITLTLDKGEQLYTQSGGMTWMNDRFTMSTNMRGGVAKSFGRMFTGESLFMATYTATEDGAQFTAAASFPGRSLPLRSTRAKSLSRKRAPFFAPPPAL